MYRWGKYFNDRIGEGIVREKVIFKFTLTRLATPLALFRNDNSRFFMFYILLPGTD